MAATVTRRSRKIVDPYASQELAVRGYPTSIVMSGKIKPTTAQFAAAFEIFNNEVRSFIVNTSIKFPGTLDFSEPGFGKSVTMATYAFCHWCTYLAFMNGNCPFMVYNQIVVIAVTTEIRDQLIEQFEMIFNVTGSPERRKSMQAYVKIIVISELIDHINSEGTPDRLLILWDEIHTRISEKGLFKLFVADARDAGRAASVDVYSDTVTQNPEGNKIAGTWTTTATPIQNTPLEINMILLFLNRFEQLEPRYVITKAQADADDSAAILDIINSAFTAYKFRTIFYPSPIEGVLFASGTLTREQLESFNFGNGPLFPDESFVTDEFQPLMVEYSAAQRYLYREYVRTEESFGKLVMSAQAEFNVMTDFYKNGKQRGYKDEFANNDKYLLMYDHERSPKITAFVTEFLTRGELAVLHSWSVENIYRAWGFFTDNSTVKRWKKWKRTGEALTPEEEKEVDGFTILKGNEFDATSPDWSVEGLIRRHEEDQEVFFLQLSSTDGYAVSRDCINWAMALPENAPVLIIISDSLSYGLNFTNASLMGVLMPMWQVGKISQTIYRIIRMNYKGTKPKRVYYMVSVFGPLGEKDSGEIITADQHRYSTSQTKYEISDEIISMLLLNGFCVTERYLPPLRSGTIVHPSLTPRPLAGSAWNKVRSPGHMPVITAANTPLETEGKASQSITRWTRLLPGFYAMWLSYLGFDPILDANYDTSDPQMQQIRISPILGAASYFAKSRNDAINEYKRQKIKEASGRP